MELFDPHGGYRKLDSFTLTTIVYLATIRFCNTFLTLRNDPKGRLYDQMVQAGGLHLNRNHNRNRNRLIQRGVCRKRFTEMVDCSCQ